MKRSASLLLLFEKVRRSSTDLNRWMNFPDAFTFRPSSPIIVSSDWHEAKDNTMMPLFSKHTFNSGNKMWWMSARIRG